MHGIPTTMLTHVLAVDWMLDRVDGFCKVLTDATAVGVICTRDAEDTGGDDIMFREYKFYSIGKSINIKNRKLYGTRSQPAKERGEQALLIEIG